MKSGSLDHRGGQRRAAACEVGPTMSVDEFWLSHLISGSPVRILIGFCVNGVHGHVGDDGIGCGHGQLTDP